MAFSNLTVKQIKGAVYLLDDDLDVVFNAGVMTVKELKSALNLLPDDLLVV